MNRIEKAVLCGLAIAILTGCVSSFSAFATQCSDIRQSVLRLHILANSDTKADQALKIKVRDRILSVTPSLFQGAQSKKQAIADARGNLGAIRKVAQQEVYQEGYRYPVSAKIVHMYFTTRTYGSVTLPAGWYDAVRITIGAAKGHNWWCVLYPSLCIPAAEGKHKIGDVLNSSQVKIVKGYRQPKYKLEFKLLELCEDVAGYFHKAKK